MLPRRNNSLHRQQQCASCGALRGAAPELSAASAVHSVLPFSRHFCNSLTHILTSFIYLSAPLPCRQRYLDLIVSAETRATFRARSKVISAIRRHLEDQGFLEVRITVECSVVD
jgi:lysyl-tRNA synthetase class II